MWCVVMTRPIHPPLCAIDDDEAAAAAADDEEESFSEWLMRLGTVDWTPPPAPPLITCPDSSPLSTDFRVCSGGGGSSGGINSGIRH